MYEQQIQFTEKQLRRLLEAIIDLYIEHMDGGSEEAQAKDLAIRDILDGIVAETQLLAAGETLTPTFTPLRPATEA